MTSGELPDGVRTEEVHNRAVAARCRSASGDVVEYDGGNAAAITASTGRVIAVGVLPEDQRELVELFADWRGVLDIDAELHLIDRTRPDVDPSMVSVLRARLPRGPVAYERDVVAAVREAGLTIVAIDRFDVRVGDEVQRWVDLRATDVLAQARRDPS